FVCADDTLQWRQHTVRQRNIVRQRNKTISAPLNCCLTTTALGDSFSCFIHTLHNKGPHIAIECAQRPCQLGLIRDDVEAVARIESPDSEYRGITGHIYLTAFDGLQAENDL